MLSFIFRIFCAVLFFMLVSCSDGGSEPKADIVTGTASNNSQSFATTRDTTLSITLSGVDDGNSYTFEILGQPNNGVLTGQVLGSNLDLSYTPNNGYVGVDSFDFVVTDQTGDSATGTVTITILDSVDPSIDTDNDGLADLVEINQWKTNPNMADTDGDSLSDWREIIDLAFNPANDNYRYNPLIADVPKLRLQMTSAPNIFLNYETIDGSSKTISTERTQSSSSTISNSTTDSRSSATEASLTIGAELTAKAGTDTGVEKKISFSASFSVSSETSHSYTEEQSTENSEAFSNGQSFEQNNAISTSSGGMQVSLRVINDSVVPFTLKSLTLSAVDVDGSGNVAGTIGNLIFDNALAAFPEFTLGVKESSGNIIFSTADLDLSTANGLLANSDGLIVGMATSEIIKSDGTAFAFDQMDLLSKTATVVIDYGPGKASERYQVSVVGDSSALSLSASDALQNILKIPYVADANNLLQLRDIAAPATDPDTYWMAVHVTGTSFGSTATVYNIDGINPNELGSSRYEVMNDLAMQNLFLAPGDFLHLVYIKDADHDGLGERAELFNGTDPLSEDTDLDGLTDKQEIDGWDVNLSSVGEMQYNTVGFGKVEFWPASPHSGYRAFNGDIDEVRLWNTVRSDAQIDAGKDSASITPQIGLIGYWPMDAIDTGGIAASPWSNTNAVQYDLSGNGNDMYLRNVDTATVVVDDALDIGMSFSLDGIDDNLTLPARLISSQRNMTLEMRFRTTTNGLLFAYQNPRGNVYTPALYVGGDGYLRGEFWVGASSSVMTSSVLVNDGLWHHVAISYDDSAEVQKLYLDGVQQVSLAGVMDHLGTSVNYHVSSDPLVLDADADGLDDLAEFNAGIDPSKADTDDDYIQDAVDIDPTLREDTDISMAGTIPVITTNENTIISWTIPVLPVSISNYKVLILEQVIDLGVAGSRKKTLVSLPADNVLPAINDKLLCSDNSQCWTVVFSDAGNLINASGSMAPIAVPADNKVHEFMALIRVNGRWYLSDNTHTAYTGTTDRITIKFVAVDNVKCHDHTDDYLCERAWQMYVDGAAVLVRPDSQWVRAGSNVALTNGLNQAASTFSFDKPATPGSCLELKTRMSEIDANGVVYARYEIHNLCYDDGWGTADSFNTVSDTLGTVSDVLVTGGTTAGQAGFQGNYVYRTPESYIWGDLARFNTGKTVVSAKGRYAITVAPAP